MDNGEKRQSWMNWHKSSNVLDGLWRRILMFEGFGWHGKILTDKNGKKEASTLDELVKKFWTKEEEEEEEEEDFTFIGFIFQLIL